MTRAQTIPVKMAPDQSYRGYKYQQQKLPATPHQPQPPSEEVNHLRYEVIQKYVNNYTPTAPGAAANVKIPQKRDEIFQIYKELLQLNTKRPPTTMTPIYQNQKTKDDS